MRIAPQTALPSGGPDSLLASSPPGSLLLAGTNALQITVAVTAGAVTGTPYYWDNTNWVPLRADTGVGYSTVQADFATVAIAHLTFPRPAEPRFWAVLKTGAGTLDYCDLAEAVL